MQIIRTDTPINLTIPSRKPTTGQVVLTGLQFDGGVEVYSIDGGTTWTETYPTQEEIDKINVFNINIITENEGDRTEFIETVEATYSNGQLSFEMEFTPIESTFYFSRVRNESANRELLKFKSFCTNQTDLQDYTTSEGLYITPPQSDNDFIVIQ